MKQKFLWALAAVACASFDVLAAAPKSFPAYVNVPYGAYVVTDVYPDRTTVVEADFQTSDTTYDKPLFGVRYSGFNFGLWLGTTAGTKYTPYWGTSANLTSKTVYHPLGYSGNVRHLVRHSKDGFTVDGQCVYTAASFASYDTTAVSTQPLYVLSVNGSQNGRTYAGKAYRMTIWHNGSIVHNYVPCIDADDVACFYDTVAGACVYSSTSTAFTAPTEATEGDYRIQDSALQVRVKAVADESAGRLSLNGGTPAAEVETWVAPGSSVTLAATTTDATSAVFRRWPERIPTETPESATITVKADYAIVVTNRVFARVNDYTYKSGGDRNINWNTDWRRGKYPEVDLLETTEAAWVRTGDIMYLTNEVPSVTWTYVSEKNTTEGTTMKKGTPYNVGWKLGTVVGDVYHNLGGMVSDCYRTFLFEDASRFQGYVRNELSTARAGWHGPILHVRPGWTNDLPQFYCMGLSCLLTTSECAGGYARAERLFGRGLFMVGWRWNNQYGANGTHFLLDHLEEGPEGQMFVGYDAPIDIRGKLWDEPSIVPGAALHLDASLASTRTVTDGKVTEWRDADGGDVVATKFGTGSVTLGTSTNGLTVIKCGSNAAFQLSKTLKAKELFVVFRDLAAYNVAPYYFVGNDAGVTAWQRHNLAGYLFRKSKDCSGATKELEAGEIWLDGTRVEPDAMEDFRHALHVVAGGLAAGSSDVAYVGALKSNSWIGNIELAEVLVYEKSLTPRERQQTCDALRKKWQWKAVSQDWDLGSVVVEGTSGGAGTFAFTEGRTALRELKYPSSTKTFTKKGDGKLEVGRLVPDGQSVTVEGGRFAFRGPSAPVKAAMAPNPSVWLDASQASTLVPDPTNDTLVCRWNDPRGQNEYGKTVYATNRPSSSIYGRSPKKITDTPTGLTALDLGTNVSAANWKAGAGGDAGILEIKNGRFQEGFFVVRHTSDSFPLVTNGGWDYFGGSKSVLISSSYCRGSILGGYWTINGETYRSDSAPTANGTWYVIGLKTLDRLDNLNYLGQQRNDSDTVGGVAYGEVIYYDRILSDEERRNTEAYLMKKWLGKDHPAAAAETPSVATMTFAAGVTNVVESNPDLAIETVAGSSETLEKTGSGEVTVGLVDSPTLANVAVSGGSLAAELKTLGDRLADKAFYRFDASQAGSMTTYQKDGTTFVSKVVHPLGQTDRGYATAGAYHVATRTNDVFLSTVTIGGKARTVFDFGDYCLATNRTDSSVLDVTGNAANMLASDWKSLREAYVVMRETPEAKAGLNPIISCWPYSFDRGSSSWLCAWWCSAIRKDDSLYYKYWMDIDGTSVDKQSEYPEGWHVFSYYGGDVTNNSYGTITFMNWGGSVVKDKSPWMHLGGQQVAEFIGFTSANTAAERLAIRDYLRAKWLGVDAAMTLERVSVASGATATLATSDGTPLAVKAVAGGGTLAASFSDLAALTVRIASPTDIAETTVAGTVTCADAVAVTLEFADPAVKPKVGTYPILTATSLANADLTKWTLTPKHANRRHYSLAKDGNTVYLKVIPEGLSFCIR